MLVRISPILLCLVGFASQLGNLAFERSVFFGKRIKRIFVSRRLFPSFIVHSLVFIFAHFHLLKVLTFVWVILLTTWVFLFELCAHLLKILKVYAKIIVSLFELSEFPINLDEFIFIMRLFLLHLDVPLYSYNTRLGGLSSIHQVRDRLKRRCLSLSWCFVVCSWLLWELSPNHIQFWLNGFGLSVANYTSSAGIGCLRPA